MGAIGGAKWAPGTAIKADLLGRARSRAGQGWVCEASGARSPPRELLIHPAFYTGGAATLAAMQAPTQPPAQANHGAAMQSSLQQPPGVHCQQEAASAVPPPPPPPGSPRSTAAAEGMCACWGRLAVLALACRRSARRWCLRWWCGSSNAACGTCPCRPAASPATVVQPPKRQQQLRRRTTQPPAAAARLPSGRAPRRSSRAPARRPWASRWRGSPPRHRRQHQRWSSSPRSPLCRSSRGAASASRAPPPRRSRVGRTAAGLGAGPSWGLGVGSLVCSVDGVGAHAPAGAVSSLSRAGCPGAAGPACPPAPGPALPCSAR